MLLKKTIKVDIFRSNVNIFIGTHEEIKKDIKKCIRKTFPEESKEFAEEKASRWLENLGRGKCIGSSNKDRTKRLEFIIVNTGHPAYKENPTLFIGETLSHEINHYVDHLMESIRSKCSETASYVTGYISGLLFSELFTLKPELAVK